ncbi:ABC transporter ATP-binding protein [Acetivibrio saccincola]|uniref:Thiamine ABC transporter permease n=1 Tax=Acetivibrio saccincola TaxID=1677857 RepID=A0A2S8R8X2_9FIRM|nr:ABC transporter ATP-binding protein [Acetivibrio saccincola]PQQ66247.1 thiamine ABC transporter permease [Acetivibrio saccincola]
MKFDFKKFLSYYKPYLRLFLSVLFCAIVAAVVTLLIPLLTRYITKTVFQGDLKDMPSQILKTGGVMFGLIVIHTLCNLYTDYRGHAMGAMMERDMRNELFEHYQKLSFRFFDEQKTGKLMSRITNDLLSLAEFYHHGPEDYVIYSVKFFGAFIILLNINVRLTLVVFAFLPVMAIFSFYFNKRLRIAYKTSKEQIGEINSQLEDNLSGIRVVKSFANEELERKKFFIENDRFLECRNNIYKNEALYSNGMNVFMQLITVAIIVFGGIGIVNTTLDLADLITFLLYIGNLTEPIQRISFITQQFQDGITCFERFMEILAVKPEIVDSPNAVDIRTVQGHIQFRNVVFRYREDHDEVLRNLSLDIQAGEYIALVGSSGVGKTTLCSLVPRFYDVSDGEVLLDGIDVRNIRLSSLRRNIGIVQQDVYLFTGTILENIRYGKPDASREEIIQAAQKANAHDFIMKLPNGYDSFIGQRGVKLSGGQKQRISIARVFLKNPPILIFDEATSSLDNESEKVIQDSLEALAANRTTIVIAHRLSTIRNAKRIVVLTENGIEEQGAHEELLARNGKYAHLYNMQSKI